MKRGIILSAVLVIGIFSGFLSFGQSVGKQTRDLPDFTKVSFGISGNLYINLGPEFKVTLEGEDAILDDVLTEVKGGKLIIRRETRMINMNQKVTVNITMPELNGLGVSGSGMAEIMDPVKTEDLSLSVSGSGKLFTTDVIVSKLDCSISGSGDIILRGEGKAVNSDISISGSGNYVGEATKIGSADISISGSGNCSCNVTESLKASVSGSGKITYEGDPKIDARVSGSGRVRSK